MRKTLLLIFTVIFIPSLFSQGLNSVTSFNTNNIIAVGNSGKIFISTSGGNGWASYTINPTVNYKSVTQTGDYYFISGDNGKIYKTSVSGLLLSEFTGPTTTISGRQ
jgi:photosystem II stability/assembly factor-like uncharacterized protein